MNDKSPTLIDEKKSKKVFIITMALFCLLPMLLDYFVLSPIYSSLSADVAQKVTSTILYYVLEVLWLIAFAVPYALVIFSIHLLPRKNARGIVIFYAVTYFLSFPARLLMTVVIENTLGSIAKIVWDLIMLGIFFAFSLLQLFIVYFVAVMDSKKHLKKLNETKMKKAQQAKKEIYPLLPISKFFNLSNPLQRSAFKMSIVMVVIKISTRIISEFFSPVPSSFVEVIVIIAYYLFDLLYGVLAYVIALLVFTFVYDKLKIKKADEDNAPSAE